MTGKAENAAAKAGQLHNGQEKPGRQANMELLRIVSMLLVTVLHFLDKGGNLTPLVNANMPAAGYLAWILETFAIVAVNVYMLLSGYFLIESSFKVKRLLQLFLQIWFYSIGIGLLAAAFGYLPEGGFGVHYLLALFLPVSMNHYWFMTAYVFMYLFMPMLSGGVRRLTKKQFQTVLVLLLAVCGVLKSVVPARLETDAFGYDAVWYLCVYLVAAYIRLYGIPFFKTGKRGVLVYLLSAAGILGITFAMRFLYLKTGSMELILTNAYHYNHILVLAASVGFFYLFYHIRIEKAGIAKFILRIAPYTLGVYLFQEHVAIRYEWQQWIYGFLGKPDGVAGLLWITPVSILLVFLMGILLDMLRALLFRGLNRLLSTLGGYRRLLLWLDGCIIDTK